MSMKRLSLHEFKKWFTEQKDMKDFFNLGLDKEDGNDKYVGLSVRSKVSPEKLLERIETDDSAEDVVIEFAEVGGTVLAVEGKRFQVEVESGTFLVPRCFCKAQKPAAE